MTKVKSKQEQQGENLLIKLAKALFSKKIEVSSGTIADDLINKGIRVTFFIKEKKDDK